MGLGRLYICPENFINGLKPFLENIGFDKVDIEEVDNSLCIKIFYGPAEVGVLAGPGIPEFCSRDFLLDFPYLSEDKSWSFFIISGWKNRNRALASYFEDIALSSRSVVTKTRIEKHVYRCKRDIMENAWTLLKNSGFKVIRNLDDEYRFSEKMQGANLRYRSALMTFEGTKIYIRSGLSLVDDSEEYNAFFSCCEKTSLFGGPGKSGALLHFIDELFAKNDLLKVC